MFHVKQSRRDPLAHLAAGLRALDEQHLLRRPDGAPPSDAISFCSNDYLGLASRTAADTALGAGASRLIAGDHDAHRSLESSLASWLGTESALVFTSGYAANVGAISALAQPGDLVVSDALNHASIIDGARLSRARIAVVPHNDTDAVRKTLASRTESHAWVVVESYYSMDADGPDLAALRRACDELGAGLFVDEAHALGVFGPEGRGRCADAGIVPDILVGTFGKALGGQGAFVAGRAVLRDWLWNRARSFVFSTGLAPVSAVGAHEALGIVRSQPDLRLAVQRLSERLRRGLGAAQAHRSMEAPQILGFGHIIPVVSGSSASALVLAARLRARGIHVHAVRPPTVPEGLARVRLTVSAQHTQADIDRAILAFGEAVRTPLTGPPE